MADHAVAPGMRSGRLVVVSCEGKRTAGGHVYWRCRCDCGEEITARASHLRKQEIQSCGCLQRERTSAVKGTHRQSRTRLYRIWQGMISRCTNEKSTGFKYYGARGITVCERWRTSFEAFLADMGQPPTQAHTLDREDSDGNYEPGNCRWATQTEQQRNRRNNRRLTIDGVTRCVNEWAEVSGTDRNVIADRLRKGWPAKAAVFRSTDRRARTRNNRQLRIQRAYAGVSSA